MPTGVAGVGGNLPQGNFIPEVWSKKLQAKFYRQTVFGAIANRDWEGEISGQGSKVNIRVTPTVVISDYEKNTDLTYQDLTDDMIELTIDRAKSYAFKVDDIDVAQSDIKIVNSTTQDASRRMMIAVDADVLGSVYADATTSMNSTAITKDTVLDYIVDLGTALDELDVPDDRRWLVLPPWAAATIKKSDLKDASISHGDLSIIVSKGASAAGLMPANGRLGMIDRFTIYLSNNLANNGTTWHTLAGTPDGIAFASQFVKTETLRLQNTFGDAMRGLNVYGFKSTQPDALVHGPITKS